MSGKFKKSCKRFASHLSAGSLPVLALVTGLTVEAGDASQPNTGYITSIITAVQDLVDTVIPLLIALALLLFIWGLVVYIFNSGDEAAKEEGKRKMIWGVIALFVIVSVWGLVALLNELTGVQQGEGVALPTGPTGAAGGNGTGTGTGGPGNPPGTP